MCRSVRENTEVKSLDHDAAVEKLRIMRHRIEGALDRFYSLDLSGDPIAMQAAALDIAAPIRVMVHHVPDKKPPSICLLHQVDPDYWKKPIHFVPLINPSPPKLPPGVFAVTRSIPLNVSMTVGAGVNKASFTRYQKGQNPKVLLRNWWTDTVWDSGSNKVSNKDIVLAMSNKEGAMHVDGDLSVKYAAAKNQGKIAISGKPVHDVARLGSVLGIAGDELLEYLQVNFPEAFL
jgi:hypothetical protein